MKPKIDLVTFTCAIAVLLGVSIPLGFMPEQSGPFVTGLYNDITENFGILFGFVPVASHDLGAANGDFTVLTLGHFFGSAFNV